MFNRLSLTFLLGLASLAPSAASAQVTRVGDFAVISAKDPLDNTNRSLAFSATTDEEKGLAWKCLGDGMNVILTFDKYIPDDRGRQLLVRHQFDGQDAPVPGYWTLGRDGKAAYLPLKDVESFTEMAKSSKRVVLRISDPIWGDTYTFDFSLSKLKSALGRIGDCG
jgi:hypothetical protein